MVVKMMKWRPWPSMPSKTFQVKLKLHALENVPLLMAGKSGDLGAPSTFGRSSEVNTVMVHIKWKGPRSSISPRFKKSLKRSKTTEKMLDGGSLVTWDEEFDCACTIPVTKDGCFLPWDVYFLITKVGVRERSVVLGTTAMNVAKSVLTAEIPVQRSKMQVVTSNGATSQATLVVSANFIELRTPEVMGFEYPILSCINGPQLCVMYGDSTQVDLDDRALSLTTMDTTVSIGDLSPKMEQASDSSRDSFGSESSYDSVDEEATNAEEYCAHSYGSLVGVNLVVEGALSHVKGNRHAEDRVPCTCKRGPVDSPGQGVDEIGIPEGGSQPLLPADQSPSQSSVRSLLSWRKRKINFMSPRRKGEPLLNKDYGEDGGDDIDFDRRLSGFPNKLQSTGDVSATNLGCIDFGDEHFAVGSWERQDFISRDGEMKLSADVFFATIDQCNERAAGESACTALVVVVASWLHMNPGQMPIKAELDTLLREGCAEWRKLCEVEAFKNLFPDRHFDLDTVLQARVRPLGELLDKSFIGFFQPTGMGDRCDYLEGAMLFDSIWDELVTKADTDAIGSIFIVSWNDHFFVLKVEQEVCYIIDTLGERLREGGKQAYILRFDNETSLVHLPVPEKEKTDSSDEQGKENPKKIGQDKALQTRDSSDDHSLDAAPTIDKSKELPGKPFTNHGTVYKGREACKEFIKGFFAALPLRELEMDVKMGLVSGTSLHQRLQIEFHYVSPLAALPLGS